MDFDFTEEQKILRSNLAGFLARHYGFDVRRQASRTDPGWRPDIWRAFAHDLGILGASLPVRIGGLGGGPVETMIIMEELGAVLALEPFIETVVLGAGLLQGTGGDAADRVLSSVVAGQAILAFAWAEPTARYRFSDVATAARREGTVWRLDGHKAVVTGAPWATHLIVTARMAGGPSDRAGLSLFLVGRDTPGLLCKEYPTIDGRQAADVMFDAVMLPEDSLLGEAGQAADVIERVGDAGVAALCAEAIGVMRRLLQDTIAYTKQRRQFGQPIADFQVLQHRMVDMFMQLELATSATFLATLSLDAEPTERAKAVSAAKVTVGNACRFVGQNAVQLHGGMGMTDELAIGHYFKRATVIEGELGTVDYHLARFAELSHASAN